MSNTVRVAASASVAALAGLFALPLYIIAIGWLTMALPPEAKRPLREVQQPITFQDVPAPNFVNPIARDEQKFEAMQICEPCDQAARWRPFATRRTQPSGSTVWHAVSNPTWAPTQPQPQPTSQTKLPLPDPNKAFGETKTGNVRCERCKKTMIGTDQKTYWTDDNQPITFICSECAAKTTKQEREKIATQWLDRVAPTLSPATKNKYVTAIQ